MSKGLSVVVGVCALVIVGASLASILPRTSNQGYAPDQPIPYSHKLHAGDLKIDCQYCHTTVERSKHASVPSVNVCMNCHRVVKNAVGTDTPSPWIQKIQDAYDSGKPIEWVRIHELPDFVYFPHKRHVAAGLACQDCHGPIETMEKVYQYSALTMGWCMECHRGRSTPKNVLNAQVASGKDPHETAPQQCTTCHY